MKKVSTLVSSGDRLTYNGNTCIIGNIKNGMIEFKTIISPTSCITEHISTRDLNKRLQSATIIK